MKGREVEIGTRIWEGKSADAYSAGRVVALSDSVVRNNMIYALLQNDSGQYTIYSFERDCNCNPRLSREIPQENFEGLVKSAMLGIELPEEKVIRPKKNDLAVISSTTDLSKETDSSDVTVDHEPGILDDCKKADPEDCSEEHGEEKVYIGFDVIMSVV